MATVNQVVKHGKDVFKKGDTVPEELVEYFSANGWIVGSEKIEAPTPEVEDIALDIVPENPYMNVGPIPGVETDLAEFRKATKVIAEQESDTQVVEHKDSAPLDTLLDVHSSKADTKSTDIEGGQ